MKFGPDGHLRVYEWLLEWKEVADLLTGCLGDCSYPMVYGKYSICSNGQCSCSGSSGGATSYFRQIKEKEPNLRCSEVTPLTCVVSQFHSFEELKDVTYFTFNSTIDNTDMENCKQLCLNDCNHKTALFRYGSDPSGGKFHLPSEILSLMNNDKDTFWETTHWKYLVHGELLFLQFLYWHDFEGKNGLVFINRIAFSVLYAKLCVEFYVYNKWNHGGFFSWWLHFMLGVQFPIEQLDPMQLWLQRVEILKSELAISKEEVMIIIVDNGTSRDHMTKLKFQLFSHIIPSEVPDPSYIWLHKVEDNKEFCIKNGVLLILAGITTGADVLEHWLCMNSFSATTIHGDKVNMERELALRTFKTTATPMLVATDVAARGLDIPNVTHVINFDLPKDIDDCVHRIGGTGGTGKSGMATTFFSNKNSPMAKALVQLMQEAKQQVPSWLTQYAETSSAYGNGSANRYGGSKFGGNDYSQE